MRNIITIIAFAGILSACCNNEKSSLQIVVTNDTHSQIEPKRGKGGYEARLRMVDSLRLTNPNTILLDAGDIFQGTPYFNVYFGKAEIEGYNIMGYDAMTLGNHEFDFGLDTLAARLQEANFPIVCANYNVEETPINTLIQPYTIVNKGDWRVGVIGIGVNPKNLIPRDKYGNVKYLEPIDAANHYADILKNDSACDIVVLLSHLGYEGEDYTTNTDDHHLSLASRNIDLIMGGHTHEIDSVFNFINASGKPVTTLQGHKSGTEMYIIEFEK